MTSRIFPYLELLRCGNPDHQRSRACKKRQKCFLPAAVGVNSLDMKLSLTGGSLKNQNTTSVDSQTNHVGRRLALALALVVGFTLTAHAQGTATATATVISGFVVAYTVTDGGSGYTEPPIVTLEGGGGTGATAVALVANGMVTQINPESPGSGYTNPPVVHISAPVAEPIVLAFQIIPLVTIYGLPGDTNQIEASTSLGAGAVWVPVATVVLTNSVQEWYDRVSPPQAWRFYRAVLLGIGSRPTPGLRFVWLPAGEFVMGSPSDEVDRRDDESPQTQVTLKRGFFIGRYAVTQGEYLSVIGSNPSAFTGDTNRPVERVSWNDATNYCAQLTARDLAAGRLPAGWAYRLPTEAEREYACRAGSTNQFNYGNDPGYTQLANYAWYSVNSGGTTHSVGEKLPNSWGLYDMSGNVWEWCSDWYGNYPGGSVTNPQGAVSGSTRILRGGCWNYNADFCRSAYRGSADPTTMDIKYGFRVVLAPAH
jgi:formylglycine-generating enzyme required for sulfatase activity